MPGLKTVLMADDDPEDREIFGQAAMESGVHFDLRFVTDGGDLIDYLHRRGAYAANDASPRPNMIFLDLNMPRVDGFDALKMIKDRDETADIPVIVFTTSSAERDVEKAYRLGAQSYVQKPFTFDDLVTCLKEIGRYWTTTSRLPEIQA